MLLVIKIIKTRLKQANLASKIGIADFVKEVYFDEKLKAINKKVT